jgi:hypothetical protein
MKATLSSKLLVNFLDDNLEIKKSSSFDYKENLKEKLKKEIYKDKEVLNNIIKSEEEYLINYDFINDSSREKDITEDIIIKMKKPKKIFCCKIEKCGKSFTTSQSLRIHIDVIHNKNYPFKCRFCEKRYKRLYSKTVHERAYHINYNPFKCIFNLCTMTFPSKQIFEAHYAKHHSG